MTNDLQRVRVVSFGYGHGPAPDAHLTVDLRDHFRDPDVRPELRQLTGRDQAVIKAVMATPGVAHLVNATADAVLAMLAGASQAPVVVALGGAGGRHRPVVAADRLAALLDTRVGMHAVVEHRDLGQPASR